MFLIKFKTVWTHDAFEHIEVYRETRGNIFFPQMLNFMWDLACEFYPYSIGTSITITLEKFRLRDVKWLIHSMSWLSRC